MTDSDWMHSAADTADRIARHELTAVANLDRCLDRIQELEPDVCALGDLDIEGARETARRVDEGTVSGLLAGVPVGIKDIIDVRGLRTTCDSPIYQDFVAARDASCVQLIRAAGGLIVGKTRTTEFAYTHPTVTRSPVNYEYSPGGSSSGSAAGVAAGFFPLALTTQTGGSTIRPASYCGVYAFKPTHGLTDKRGVHPLAPSLDTIGWYGRSVEDLRLLFSILGRIGARADHHKRIHRRPKVALCRTPYWHQASLGVRTLVERIANQLEAELVELPDEFRQAYEDHAALMALEAARSLRAEYQLHRQQLSSELVGLIQQGLEVGVDEERSVRNRLAKCRAVLDAILEDYDCFITPSAPGSAPKSLASTGDSIFNRLWTAMHVPCIQIPAGKASNGMPLGVQFVSRRYSDDLLLDHCTALEPEFNSGA